MPPNEHRRGLWIVRLSQAAEADFREILRWTAIRFGDRQARSYEQTLARALEALMNGPDVAGTQSREDLMQGLRALRVARMRHKGRHLIFFRVENRNSRAVDVLRILHDSMDFARHLPGGARI